jgi:hypothetical protein
LQFGWVYNTPAQTRGFFGAINILKENNGVLQVEMNWYLRHQRGINITNSLVYNSATGKPQISMMTFDGDNSPQGMIFGAHGYFDTASDNRVLMFARVDQVDKSLDWINYFNPSTVPIDSNVPPFIVNVKGKTFVV